MIWKELKKKEIESLARRVETELLNDLRPVLKFNQKHCEIRNYYFGMRNTQMFDNLAEKILYAYNKTAKKYDLKRLESYI